MKNKNDETGKTVQNPAKEVKSPNIPTKLTRDGSDTIRFGGKGNDK